MGFQKFEDFMEGHDQSKIMIYFIINNMVTGVTNTVE